VHATSFGEGSFLTIRPAGPKEVASALTIDWPAWATKNAAPPVRQISGAVGRSNIVSTAALAAAAAAVAATGESTTVGVEGWRSEAVVRPDRI
jgi:hypothetical protein